MNQSPTISIFYSFHASFNDVYDAIAVYSVGNKLEDLYSYKLKEEKANPNKASLPPAAKKVLWSRVTHRRKRGKERTGAFRAGTLSTVFFGNLASTGHLNTGNS